MKRIFEIHELIEKLTPVFVKHDVVFAYLFGSTVTNQNTARDIDIAVYCRTIPKESFDKKLSIHLDMCRALSADTIDIVVLNNTNNLILIDEIIRNGIVIFDADTSFREQYECSMIHKAIDFKTQRLLTIGI
ncbi:MAG: nucleotidyltransferase domain-containing protein [Spirochaetota bacterium]